MLKILLIADVSAHTQRLTAVLQTRGYQVVHKANGMDALKVTCDEYFHMVLMDYRLPDIDGLRLYQLMRPTLPTTPIILMADHSDKCDAAEASGFGFEAFLIKPVNTKQLFQIIADRTKQKPTRTPRVLLAQFGHFMTHVFSIRAGRVPKP